MRQFTIITSRGTTSTLVTDDPAMDLDEAITVAQTLHRPVNWVDTVTYEGVALGNYVHNGRTERIAVIDQGADADVHGVIAWVNQANRN